MTTTATTVRHATPDDVEHLARLLTAAFLDGTLGPWLIGDRRVRAEVYPSYFEIFAEHTLGHGVVEVIGTVAAAFWLPVVHGSTPAQIDNYHARLAAAVGDHLPRFQALDAAMDTHHRTGVAVAHDYLAFLAVHPDHQRQGLGSTLLQQHHRHLDNTGVHAYLEATNRDNVRLYRRHGYQLRPPIAATPGSPPLYPMLRPPAAVPTSG